VQEQDCESGPKYLITNGFADVKWQGRLKLGNVVYKSASLQCRLHAMKVVYTLPGVGRLSCKPYLVQRHTQSQCHRLLMLGGCL